MQSGERKKVKNQVSRITRGPLAPAKVCATLTAAISISKASGNQKIPSPSPQTSHLPHHHGLFKPTKKGKHTSTVIIEGSSHNWAESLAEVSEEGLRVRGSARRPCAV